MYIRIITIAISMIFLASFQIAFVSALPTWLNDLNLVLVVLLMILGFFSFKTALIWASVVGLIWDVYSFNVFGVRAFSLLCSLFLANFLLENFFTNRSLYSFVALTLVAGAIFELFLYTFTFLHSLIFGLSFEISAFWPFLSNEAMKIGSNLVLTVFFFYLINYFSKRFKPMFLIR